MPPVPQGPLAPAPDAALPAGAATAADVAALPGPPPPSCSGSRLGADLALLGATLVWGTTFVLVRDALADASPGLFLLLRFALASGLFAIVLAALGELRALGSRPLLRDGAVLGLLLGAAFLLQTWGLRYTSPSRSAYVTSLSVLLVPFLQRAIGGPGLGRGPVAGTVLAAGGLTLLGGAGLAGGLPPNRGDVLTAGCAALFALHIVAAGAIAPRHQALPLTAAQTAAAGLLFVPAAILEPARLFATPRLAIALAVTAALATCGAFFGQLWAQRRTTAVRVGVILALEPVFAAALSYSLGRERLGPFEAAGGALIVAGVLVSELLGRRVPLR